MRLVPTVSAQVLTETFIVLCFPYIVNLDYGMNCRQICKHVSREDRRDFCTATRDSVGRTTIPVVLALLYPVPSSLCVSLCMQCSHYDA